MFLIVNNTLVHLFVPKANTKINHTYILSFFFSKSFLTPGQWWEFSDAAPLSAGRPHLSVPFFSSLMHKYVFARFRETWKFRLKAILCYGQGLIDMVTIITTWLRVWDNCGHCGQKNATNISLPCLNVMFCWPTRSPWPPAFALSCHLT